MNEQTRSLATRIRNELPNVERALLRAAGSFKEAQRNADDRYLDSVALNLHGFYNGPERLFELIASAIDRHVPTGENWHQVLLQQMSQETPNARPAVLRERTYQQLDEYRGFRHVVRNIYAFNLDPAKLKKLVDAAPPLFEQARLELLAFADFLEQQASP
jgi:hypothetical protein